MKTPGPGSIWTQGSAFIVGRLTMAGGTGIALDVICDQARHAAGMNTKMEIKIVTIIGLFFISTSFLILLI